jgi:hypothetical protein
VLESQMSRRSTGVWLIMIHKIANPSIVVRFVNIRGVQETK